MAKTLEESQEALLKAFPSEEDPVEDDAITELNNKGITEIRKGAGAEDEPEDEEEEKEEEGDTKKSLDDVTQTEFLDEDEVYGRIAKSADGDLAMLINGNEAIDDMIKSFSGVVGDGNRETAKAIVLIKSIQHNQTLQNKAIIQLAHQQEQILELLGAQPVKKANTGAFVGGQKDDGTNRRTDSAIDKSLEIDSPFVGDDRFGGLRPDELSSVVKSYYNDPDTRKQFGLTAEHLVVQKSGLTRLPKALVQHMESEGLISLG